LSSPKILDFDITRCLHENWYMHIYFSGIGGTGLSPLAHLVLDCGYTVSGSDREDSQNVQDLVARGVDINLTQTLDEVNSVHTQNPIDWIIATSALPENHPHKSFATSNNIRISKRHELINQIVKDKNLKLIAVAGTHGKTTTVGMMVWIFGQLQIPISYLIGTNISYGRSGQFSLGSQYFVYECDEFDRNFLNFEPYLSIIPSLDYDHPDTYKTEKDYSEAFVQFMSQSKSVISWEVVNRYMQKVYADQGLGYTKMLDGKEIYFLQDDEPNNQEYYMIDRWIKLPGILNRRNALVAMSGLASFCEMDMDQMLKAVASFPGTQRRFEKLLDNLYSDYGHHPAEIFATLQMASEVVNEKYENQISTFEGKLLVKSGQDLRPKIVLVYQPHQNIRQHDQDIQAGYGHCFGNADKVYWLPTYLSREYCDLSILTPQQIVDQSGLQLNPKNANVNFEIADLNPELKAKIKSHLDSGDLVIVMGAGDIDTWARSELVV
jgi:UDP-N-acetylmuramate--alanine ligase